MTKKCDVVNVSKPSAVAALLGLMQLIDGLVTVVTFGTVTTNLAARLLCAVIDRSLEAA